MEVYVVEVHPFGYPVSLFRTADEALNYALFLRPSARIRHYPNNSTFKDLITIDDDVFTYTVTIP